MDEGALELVWTTEVVVDGVAASRSWNYVVRVSSPEFGVDDPDGSVMDVRWFSPGDAVRLLREVPYPPLAVPSAGFLADGVRADWAFTLRGETWSWELSKVQG